MFHTYFLYLQIPLQNFNIYIFLPQVIHLHLMFLEWSMPEILRLQQMIKTVHGLSGSFYKALTTFTYETFGFPENDL